MRRIKCSLATLDELEELNASDADRKNIKLALQALASDQVKGDPLPIPLFDYIKNLDDSDLELFQYMVGRYRLNYTLTETMLFVVSVNV